VLKSFQKNLNAKDQEIEMLKDMVRTTNGVIKQRESEIRSLKRKVQKTPIKQPLKADIEQIEEREESSENEQPEKEKPNNEKEKKVIPPVQPRQTIEPEEGDHEENYFFKRNYDEKIDQYYQNLENRAGHYNNSDKIKSALSPGYNIRWPKKSAKLLEKREDGEANDEAISSNGNELSVDDIIKNSIEKVKAKNIKYVII
jgi:hypothetical protein